MLQMKQIIISEQKLNPISPILDIYNKANAIMSCLCSYYLCINCINTKMRTRKSPMRVNPGFCCLRKGIPSDIDFGLDDFSF